MARALPQPDDCVQTWRERNWAVTGICPVPATTQAPLPLQTPPQPTKTAPASGFTSSVVEALGSTSTSHCVGQEIAPPDTFPGPVTLTTRCPREDWPGEAGPPSGPSPLGVPGEIEPPAWSRAAPSGVSPPSEPAPIAPS